MQPYAYGYNLGSNVPMPVSPVQYQGNAFPVTFVPATQVQGQQFGGMQVIYVQDPLTELENCTGVIIRQQPEFYEALTGCETPNRYHVFGETPQGQKYLFKCMERSGCFMRFCCPSNLREFNMDISHVANEGIQTLSKKFANAYKPFKIPCFCCNRQEIYVNLDDQNKEIGKIKNIFACCDPEFEIFEANGNLKYFIHADCCQCGLLCANNICGKFSTAIFNIYAAGTNNKVATISKMSAQSYAEVMTDADSYRVTFPKGSSAYDKLLIIALGLMIDYQYFETDASGNDQRRHGYRYRYY